MKPVFGRFKPRLKFIKFGHWIKYKTCTIWALNQCKLYRKENRLLRELLAVQNNRYDSAQTPEGKILLKCRTFFFYLFSYAISAVRVLIIFSIRTILYLNKRTLGLVSSEPLFIELHDGFTTVSFIPLFDNRWRQYPHISSW